ncbi:MAG: hypothetical protein JO087_03730 [Actinobacteria bacterium]|nr:hypothetical protein [Actinomycetota bacterium]
MARVTVTPEQFTMVKFDHGRIVELAGRVADTVGIPGDRELRIEVDEANPLGRVHVTSLDPITITVEGGAFEDAKRPRSLSDISVTDVLGRYLFRVRDRLDPAFGEPPPDDKLSLQQAAAWDVYAVGRCERAGFEPSKPRRLYHFRNRHGFTDVADEAFEELWKAEGLTWADIEAVCARTEAARVPVG